MVLQTGETDGSGGTSGISLLSSATAQTIQS